MIKKLIDQFRKYAPDDALKNIVYHWLTREQHKAFGTENPGKAVYIIRPLAEKSPWYIGPVHNLMANYFYVLSHLCYARERGWTPVVDQLNYPVYNSQSMPINGSENAWEYFWEQPGDVTLEEAYRSRHAVLSKRSWFWEWDMGYAVEHYTDAETVAFYAELAGMTSLNEATRAHVERQRAHFLPEGEKVLGVNVRTGGYARQSAEHGKGHPIQPELDELISITNEKMTEWGMDRVFLACETEHAIASFKEAFGEKLIAYPRQRAELGTEYLPDREKSIYLPDRSYQTALDYLTEMEILSACNGLIGSVTSGFRYAIVRNANRFEHVEVIDRRKFEDGRRKNA